MLDRQMLFATCPAGGAIDYRIDFPIESYSPGISLRLTLPDAQIISTEPEGGIVSLEQSQGPGVWRVVVDIVDTSVETKVIESLIVDTVIVEDSDEKTRVAVEDATKTMIADDSVRPESVALYRKLHGREIPEILRLLSNPTMSRGIDLRFGQLRGLQVLRESLGRPEARPYLPAILAIVSELLCTERGAKLAGAEFELMVSIQLPQQLKWLYFFRVFSQMESGVQLQPEGAQYTTQFELGLAAVARQLALTTPTENRSLVLQRADERTEINPELRKHLGDLYKWRR